MKLLNKGWTLEVIEIRTPEVKESSLIDSVLSDAVFIS